MAVDRNTSTAAKDRTDSRGSPQSPWPLVQPLDSSVPAPTSAPAITSLVVELASVTSMLSKGTRRIYLYSKSALMSAEAKTMPITTMAFTFVAYPGSINAYLWGT
jgi:hypothetical protein